MSEELLDSSLKKDNEFIKGSSSILIEEKILKANKTCFQRYLGKMETGSLRGSIFGLSSIALGTGCFSLPLRCTQIGLINGIILIIIGAIISYWTMICMEHAARKSKYNNYSLVVKDILGYKTGIFLDIAIIIDIFVVITAYLVVIYSLIGRVIYDFNIIEGNYDNFEVFEKEIWDKNIYKFSIMYSICCIILIPLCCLRDISKMRYTSLLGIITLSYGIIVIIIESPYFYIYYLKNIKKENDKNTHPNFYSLKNAFKSDLIFLQSFATIFFCFNCHIGVFPVYQTLKNNTTKRIKKVFRRSVLLNTLIYALISISGFLTSPINSPDLIIYRPNNGVFTYDTAMIIAKIGIAISLTLAIGPNFNSFRISFYEFFGDSNSISNFQNFLLSSITMLISTLISVLFRDILTYISLLGGLIAVIICILIPGCLYVKSNDYNLSHWKNIFAIFLIIILSTIGFISAIQTILFTLEKFGFNIF